VTRTSNLRHLTLSHCVECVWILVALLIFTKLAGGFAAIMLPGLIIVFFTDPAVKTVAFG
jgi:hypothetical protein